MAPYTVAQAAVRSASVTTSAPPVASLGQLRLQSALGRRLRAEIDVGALRRRGHEDLTVRLAPVDVYQQAGIAFNRVLIGARTSIEQRDGNPVIVLTTRGPVNDPFLEVLVELESKSGRLIRKYTILFDPPTDMAPPAVGAPIAPTPARIPRVSPSSTRTPSAKLPTATGAEYRVTDGDTLSKIASLWARDGLTPDQMLVALYRTNNKAFIDGDVNLLRADSVLKIPDRTTAEALHPAEAAQAARALMYGSREQRGKVAVKETAISARQPTGARPGPQVAAQVAPDSRIVVSRAKPGNPASPGATATARADDLAARNRKLKETQSRVTELEKSVVDLQKLIEIRNAQIAEIEQRIAGASAAAITAAPNPADKAPEPTANRDAVAGAPKPATETSRSSMLSRKPAAQTSKPESGETTPKLTRTPTKPEPALLPTRAPSRLDDFFGGPLFMVSGLAGVLLLIIGYAAYARAKKKHALRNRLSEALSSTAADAEPGLQIAGASVDQGAAVAAGKAEDTDLLEEADVYLSYGRDAQAEQILHGAIQEGETRPLAYSMLLQIYAKQRETRKFEATVLKMRSLVEGKGLEWDKAMALGRSIDPSNSIYRQGEPTEVVPQGSGPAMQDSDVGATTEDSRGTTGRPVEYSRDMSSQGPDKSSPVDVTIDFDLGRATSETRVPAPPEKPSERAQADHSSNAIDFDLGVVTTEMLATTGAKPSSESRHPQGRSAEPSFEPGSDQTGMHGERSTAGGSAPDLTGISLDLNVTEFSGIDGGTAKLREVATKLQLAKSFEEIGDYNAAREFLEEVIKEGDSAQQAQAKKLLDSLR